MKPSEDNLAGMPPQNTPPAQPNAPFAANAQMGPQTTMQPAQTSASMQPLDVNPAGAETPVTPANPTNAQNPASAAKGGKKTGVIVASVLAGLAVLGAVGGVTVALLQNKNTEDSNEEVAVDDPKGNDSDGTASDDVNDSGFVVGDSGSPFFVDNFDFDSLKAFNAQATTIEGYKLPLTADDIGKVSAYPSVYTQSFYFGVDSIDKINMTWEEALHSSLKFDAPSAPVYFDDSGDTSATIWDGFNVFNLNYETDTLGNAIQRGYVELLVDLENLGDTSKQEFHNATEWTIALLKYLGKPDHIMVLYDNELVSIKDDPNINSDNQTRGRSYDLIYAGEGYFLALDIVESIEDDPTLPIKRSVLSYYGMPYDQYYAWYFKNASVVTLDEFLKIRRGE